MKPFFTKKKNLKGFKYEPLKVPRNGHRTVSINDLTVIHVGGIDGALSMEYWHLRENGAFDIRQSDFSLTNWYGYPETFVVGQYEFDP